MFYYFHTFIFSINEIKRSYDATWLKIFYHNSSNQCFFANQNEALKCDTFQKFSILGDINENFLINGKYEFLLEYPEVIGYNRWVQNVNPIFQSDSSIPGYFGIQISWNTNYWGGLTKSSRSTWTLLDGSVGHSDWFYAIGSYVAYGPSQFPGPNRAVSLCYLWIRVDDTKYKIPSNLYQKFKFNYLKLIFNFMIFF